MVSRQLWFLSSKENRWKRNWTIEKLRRKIGRISGWKWRFRVKTSTDEQGCSPSLTPLSLSLSSLLSYAYIRCWYAQDDIRVSPFYIVLLNTFAFYHCVAREMADEASIMKQRFFHDHLPRLKPIDESSMNNSYTSQKQPILQSSSFLPPIAPTAGSVSSTDTSQIPASIANTESPPPSVVNSLAIREAADRFLQKNRGTSFSSAPSTTPMGAVPRPKRTARYEHIQSRIDTGLPRVEPIARLNADTYQLKPTRPINWTTLKQEVEQDIHIRAQAKRLQFTAGITYTSQLSALVNLVRNKVKTHLTMLMGLGKERYKIVVQVTVFQNNVAGLHVASRCLWNTQTDNSITIKMQGVDCDVLFVVFLCYTDVGAI